MSDSLKVDLYELTMSAAYLRAGRVPEATFELFVRRMPKNRGYLLCAGLQQALEYLQSFHFDREDLRYLRTLPVFADVDPSFFEAMENLRFTGDVWAVPEGTLVFANEPLLRITAPLIQAQLLETYLLSSINFQTMAATKASRVAAAARGRPVVDFGSRRAHGPDAGVLAARACFIGGCQSTSNLEAGRRFSLPVAGTMAHSFVMTFESEAAAFRRYLESFPRNSTLLVDTYDTLSGVKTAADLGPGVGAVRLDSGDLLRLSRQARKLLDAAGRQDVHIFASGDLNEYGIEKLLSQAAPIDAFGVGTDMVTSRDAPALDGVYKLVEISEPDGSRSHPIKLSEKKGTWPGPKQVFRRTGKRSEMLSDIVGLASETRSDNEPLLKKVMTSGVPMGQLPSLEEVRNRAHEQLSRLPPRFKRLQKPSVYSVKPSSALKTLIKNARPLNRSQR
jgi:nicotinate phosphoribosyltransferase